MQHRKFNRALLITLSLLVAGIFLTSAGVILAQEDEPTEEPEAPAPIHWTYEGEEGPEHWSELSADFELCSTGKAESPVDITEAQGVNLSDIAFDYGESNVNIFNNGHTIQVNMDEGSTISYNGLTYKLLQFHFHTPSEHTVDGEHAEMEIHFVHQDIHSGDLAVVGVMLVEGDENNESYAPIFDNLPPEASDPTATGDMLDLNTLLPEDHHFTTYNGSLTTPPCSEIVRWLVLSEPVELSAEQIEAFKSIYEMNARPTQPLNGRDLLADNS